MPVLQIDPKIVYPEVMSDLELESDRVGAFERKLCQEEPMSDNVGNLRIQLNDNKVSFPSQQISRYVEFDN